MGALPHPLPLLRKARQVSSAWPDIPKKGVQDLDLGFRVWGLGIRV